MHVATSDAPERRRRHNAYQPGASEQCVQSLSDLDARRSQVQVPRDLFAFVGGHDKPAQTRRKGPQITWGNQGARGPRSRCRRGAHKLRQLLDPNASVFGDIEKHQHLGDGDPWGALSKEREASQQAIPSPLRPFNHPHRPQ